MTDAELSDLEAKAKAAIANQYPEFSMTPAAVLALIDEVRRLQKKVEMITEFQDGKVSFLRNENERMRKALDTIACDAGECTCQWYGGVCSCYRKIATKALASVASEKEMG